MKIKNGRELFDILAKYQISKATLKFSYDGIVFQDIHGDITFEGGDLPDDVRDAVRLAIKAFTRCCADSIVNQDDESWNQEYGDYEDYPLVTFDVLEREAVIEGDIVQRTNFELSFGDELWDDDDGEEERYGRWHKRV